MKEKTSIEKLTSENHERKKLRDTETTKEEDESIMRGEKQREGQEDVYMQREKEQRTKRER